MREFSRIFPLPRSVIRRKLLSELRPRAMRTLIFAANIVAPRCVNVTTFCKQAERHRARARVRAPRNLRFMRVVSLPARSVDRARR